jgi:hypothetical protein
MARPEIAPVTTELPEGKRQVADREERHPAYAQIAASRYSGGTRLYGSDFEHHNFMVVTIRRSKLQRGLAHDWPMAQDELIEVAMSESQWAAFVSTPNSGMGTQCTIRFYKPEGQIPGIVDQRQRSEHFTLEAQERIADVVKRIDNLDKVIDGLKCSQKQKDELRKETYFARQQIESNLPYVARTFGEHMEKTVDRAKTEVHAYVENVIRRAGVEALTGGQLPFTMPPERVLEGSRDVQLEGASADLPDVQDGHEVERRGP